MSPPRLTIGRVMALVVVLAANLALGRAASQPDLEVLLCLLLPTLLLQVAAWAAWRDRRPGRAFWVGYLLAGALVTGSLAWGLAHPERWGPAGPNGMWVQVEPGSWHYRAWTRAIETVLNRLDRALSPYAGAIPRALGMALAVGCVWAPQVLAGVLGGLAGRLAARLRRREAQPAEAGP